MSREHKPRPFAPTPFQKLFLSLPHGQNLWAGGTRGGSKTSGIAQMVTHRCHKYGSDVMCLVVRPGPLRSHRSFIDELGRYMHHFHGRMIRSRKSDLDGWIIEPPTGGKIFLDGLPPGLLGERRYDEVHHGQNYSHLFADELTGNPTPTTIDKLLSSLRSGTIPTQAVLSGNPGGAGHNWVAKRYETGRPRWTPQFDVEHGEGSFLKFRNCPSSWRQNPHLPPDYESRLMAAAGGDMELLKAWVTGDWSISRGAYFARSLGKKIQIYWEEPHRWPRDFNPADWPRWLNYDHGTASPAVAYVMTESPGAIGPDGLYYPAGSRILLDEWGQYVDQDLSKGLRMQVPEIAHHLRDLAERWGAEPYGIADEQIFAGDGRETIAHIFAQNGVNFERHTKPDRAQRAQKMSIMLQAAGTEESGLYVSERCRYWWETVPYLQNDPREPEKVAKGPYDHGYDASSYGLYGPAMGGPRIDFRFGS